MIDSESSGSITVPTRLRDLIQFARALQATAHASAFVKSPSGQTRIGGRLFALMGQRYIRIQPRMSGVSPYRPCRMDCDGGAVAHRRVKMSPLPATFNG